MRHKIGTCPNCDDGCNAQLYCDGCAEYICEGCYNEHNNDAGDHTEKEAQQ